MIDGFAQMARRTEEIKPFLAVQVFERAEELARQGHAREGVDESRWRGRGTR